MIREYTMFLLIGICLILMIFSFITDSLSKRRRYILFCMALFAMLLLIADKLARSFNGDISTAGFWITRASKFMAYGSFLLIVYIFNQYLKDLFVIEGKRDVIPKSLSYSEYVVYTGAVALVTSQFTGYYYYFDASNNYIRAEGYALAYMFPVFAVMIQAFVIIRYQKFFRKRMLLPLILFTILPILGAIPQFFKHGVSYTSTAIVGVIVLLFCFSVFDTNQLVKIAHEKEIDALKKEQKNVKLMVSQTAQALAEAIDAKDKYTNGHSRRVAEYSAKIAKEFGKSEEECEEIYLSALLHDVGKIGIPNAIINKEGKLTDEEFETIKKHPILGNEILSKISIEPNLAVGAHYHHERFDGKGYPDGLIGNEIPEIARIIAVADTYDAMASKRSYRDVLPKAKIRAELLDGIGTQFDPVFAKIMVDLIDKDRWYNMREM